MKTPTRWMLIFVFVACQVLAFFLLFPNPAFADDCLSDPLNGADCMRTGGTRQLGAVLVSMAGTMAATLSSIVGGSVSTIASAVAGAAATAAGSAVPGVSGAFEGAVSGTTTVPGFPETPLPPTTPETPISPPTPETPIQTIPPPVSGETPPVVTEGMMLSPLGLPGLNLPELINNIANGGLSLENLPGPVKDFLTNAVQAGGEMMTYVNQNLPGFVDSGPFDKIKNTVGTANALTTVLTEYVHVVESPETITSIHNALTAWQNNPTKEAAEEYLKQLGQTTDSRLGKLGGILDKGTKVIDVVEALGKGINEANKEGFTGIDRQLIIWSELGKKNLTWLLTKNPVVGVVDWAVGSATQLKYGKDGRIDVGAIIDKGAEKWKDVVKEYANNTGGGPEADAADQTADQFLRSVRRIKGQVDSGQISREEGSARAHKLQQILMGGPQ